MSNDIIIIIFNVEYIIPVFESSFQFKTIIYTKIDAVLQYLF